MVNTQLINSVISKLIDAYDPLAIYIFGPCALDIPNYFDATDLDILVVVDKLTNTRYKMLVKVRLALAYLPLSKDLTLSVKKSLMSLLKMK